MKGLRTAIFWAHLVTGVFVAVVVLIMSATGVALTYQRQITAWADTRGLDGGPPVVGAERLSPEALLARVQATEEGRPTTVRWHADPQRPVEVAYGRQRTLFVNGYTGAVLGAGDEGVREFFRTMVSWHRWLGAEEGENRELARAITGASNLGFLFLVLSGFYLWWPRNWTRQAFRSVLVFRWGLSPKARDFNWHNVVGFWSAVPLAVVVASAVVISYPWASDLVYQLAGDTPPQGRGPGGGGAGRDGEEPPLELEGMESLLARAEAQLPGWRSITLQLSGTAGEPVTFSIDRGDGGQPQRRATLELDRATGAVVKWETFADNSPGRQWRSILRFAHTGEVAGLVGQTLAGVVSLGALLLVWTGLALSWRRFRAWRGRGQKPQRSAPPERRRRLARTA